MIDDVMPNGAGALFFIQIFSTLSFSVLYSTLVLYMTKQLGLDKTTANSITGVFLAFNYGLHLLGGYFGGRLLSNRALFAWGMFAQVLGCFLISIPSTQALYWGLGAFLTGSGLNVTCINCMLTQRFKPEDKKREAAFLWNYSGMNIGFFIGFSISGYFQLQANYHQLFILSSMGNLMALLIMFANWKGLKDISTPLTQKTRHQQAMMSLLGVAVVIAMIPMMKFFVQRSHFGNNLVMIAAILMFSLLFVLALQQTNELAKRKMFAYLILALASMVFWTLYQIAPMGLTLFIKHNVNTELFGLQIAPQWVQNINTLVIVIGGPLLSFWFQSLRKKGVNMSIPRQFAIALLLIGVGFAVLPIGIHYANAEGLTHFNWVILSYIFQSIGELFISPIGYAMVGQLAPTHLQGIMMGAWMMVTGVAATMSQYFSNVMVGPTELSDPLVSNSSYSHTFAFLGWGAIACSLLLFLMVPIIMRLISNHTNEKNNTMVQEVAA